MFGRRSSKPPKPSREQLEVKIDSVPPGAPVPLEREDVTGVIVLTLERLATAHEHSVCTVRAAAERLISEASAARELTRSLSPAPPPPPPTDRDS